MIAVCTGPDQNNNGRVCCRPAVWVTKNLIIDGKPVVLGACDIPEHRWDVPWIPVPGVIEILTSKDSRSWLPIKEGNTKLIIPVI